MKPRNTLTGPEEHEIAKRLALRRSYATKNLMREFNASRSAIDRISRESRMLLRDDPATSPVQFDGHTSAPCAR